jgi:biotin carboxylase
MLGASWLQIPAIQYACSQGYQVFTCDNRPDNPGHAFADECFDISTTDREGVLELAKRLKVDGVLAYASDPSVPAAAYAANELGLPGNPPSSVDLLTHKDEYRRFLRDNHFCSPKFWFAKTLDEAKKKFNNFHPPIMIKPVDSSGSKGVSRIDHAHELPLAFERGQLFSRCKRLIGEEYFERIGHQITGDGFIVDGELAFLCLSHEHYNLALSNIVPVGESFPWRASEPEKTPEQTSRIRQEIVRLIELLGLQVGAFNVEIRIDANNQILLLEFGPRNGGNWMPEAIRETTGVDLIAYSVEAALGNDCSCLGQVEPTTPVSTYMLHAEKDGRFDKVSISAGLGAEILQQTMLVDPGDEVGSFCGSHMTLGALLLKFDSVDEMVEKMDRMRDFVRVEVS